MEFRYCNNGFSLPALLFSLLSMAVFVRSQDELEVRYCSSFNTGSDYVAVTDKYQSHGFCFDLCKAEYAFAVVQGSSCWCSNYIPSQSEAFVDSCNQDCPGYPFEKCGSQSEGLYGYIALPKEPSGTMTDPAVSPTATGDPDSSVSLPAPPASSPVDEVDVGTLTVRETVTEPGSLILSLVTPKSEQTSPTPDPSSSAPQTEGRSATAPITSVQVITVSGAVVTQTVTTLPTPGQEAVTAEMERLSGGEVAGAVIGAIAGLSLIVVFLLWLLWYRRRRVPFSADSEKARSPHRNTSVLSRTGLLNSPEKAYAPAKRNSMYGFDDAETITPVSERRNSRPLIFDQRLNPNALMEFENGSHLSIITMQDNRDYTRTLNVRNPDPPEQ